MDATLNAAPNPATVGSHVNLAGEGYEPGKSIHLVFVSDTGYSQAYDAGVWSDGRLDAAYIVPPVAGDYTVTAYQAGKGRKLVEKAEAVFVVS